MILDTPLSEPEGFRYVNFVNATIRPEREPELLEAIGVNAAASVTEPGCAQFDVLMDASEPHRMALYELYRDEAAFAAHQQTAHHQRYFNEAHELLAERRKTAFIRRTPGPMARFQNPEERQMAISLVISAVARDGQREALLAALDKVARASLAEEPGCLQFDVLTDQAEPNKIMLYEVYADEAASEAHQQTQHFKDFLAHGVPLFETHALKPFKRAAP